MSIKRVLIISDKDEVFYTKDSHGNVCGFTIEEKTPQNIVKNPVKNTRIVKILNNRIKELESEAEEYFQEIGNDHEAELCLAKADELKQLIEML